MELKDMILSTLAELDEGVKKEGLQPPVYDKMEKAVEGIEIDVERTHISAHLPEPECEASTLQFQSPSENHRQFYVNLRERVLVLFEGFQSPNNKNIEAKLDLTLNFLEYLLATIDEELERMDKAK